MKAKVTGAPAKRSSGQPQNGRAAPGGRQARSRSRADRRIVGPRIGKVVGVTRSGGCLVDFTGNRTRVPIEARTVPPVGPEDLGKEAVLLFDQGFLDRPIVLGLLGPTSPGGVAPAQGVRVEADGETLTLSAESQIVLRCGEASITLTRAGKVLISGAYVLSRSSGVNKIKGGSIQLN
jgi:hypothetical protein